MMPRSTIGLWLVVSMTAATAMADEAVVSVYTPLPDNLEKRCKVLERGSEQIPGYLKVECPGLGNYRVHYDTDGDHGSLLSLIYVGKKKAWPLIPTEALPEGGLCPQGYAWVTAKQLEWRVLGSKAQAAPFALIYRIRCVDMMNATPVTTEILAVAKVAPDQSCLIGKVTSNREANIQARALADRKARDTKCQK